MLDDECPDLDGLSCGPHQRLAAAVLARAVRDLRDHTLPRHVHHQAQAFAASEWAGFWCALAGLDVELFRQRLTRGGGEA